MNHCKHVHTEETIIPSEYFPTFYTGFIFRYNEEGSDIWNDANTLERVLMTKVKELAIEHPGLVSLKKTISTIGKVIVLRSKLPSYYLPLHPIACHGTFYFDGFLIRL